MPIDDPYAVWCEIDKAFGDFYGETLSLGHCSFSQSSCT